ncbi:MAG: S28 family serine protease [Legionella sp.]|uniref:S28 family serine protease n=1 Tax=Legionella sp. TaxID=459 RepID=UPI002851986F|nr:S28 family serine protease [Legionella sp.]
MFNTKFISLCASLCALSLSSHAGAVERYMQQQLEAKNSLNTVTPTQQYNFQQLINHNDPASGTFAQRYYIDERYGPENDAPVFFYICGEATCTPNALNGAIRHYAQKFHAKLIALEHRYYGASIPVARLSAKNLRFLTTEAALDDLAYFQRHISQQKNWTGSWIAFGGSYPGSLSAYYRLKFPYLVTGALASSAPVMAKEDFIEYDQHVTEMVGPHCAEQMREVVHAVEASLDDVHQLAQMKELFGASKVDDPVDFLYLIADIGAGAVQYGEKDEFCATLSSSVSPLVGYAEMAHKLYQNSGLSAVDFTAQGAMDETVNTNAQGLSMRQWYYQSCTEYGYWQNAHPNPELSTRSALINLDYHHQVCKRLFQLTQPAQTSTLNATLYYPIMDSLVSKIFFTNGEQDPWSTLSLAEKNGNAINANLNYQLILGAAHCDDLHRPSVNDSDSLQQARKTMESLLSQWLAID